MNISYAFAHPTFKIAGGCMVGTGGNPTTKKPGLHRPLHRFSKPQNNFLQLRGSGVLNYGLNT
jgi:hypothetical protein